MDKQYYTYILTNKNHNVLYTGVTNDLIKRVYQHKNNLIAGFTQKYNIHHLVYYEIHQEVLEAITREKQIKGWVRKKKIDLINAFYSEWQDLYETIV